MCKKSYILTGISAFEEEEFSKEVVKMTYLEVEIKYLMVHLDSNLLNVKC